MCMCVCVCVLLKARRRINGVPKVMLKLPWTDFFPWCVMQNSVCSPWADPVRSAGLIKTQEVSSFIWIVAQLMSGTAGSCALIIHSEVKCVVSFKDQRDCAFPSLANLVPPVPVWM